MTWVVTEHLDFDKYFEKPTELHLQSQGTHVLSPNLLVTSQLFVRYNEVTSKDGWIQIGLPGDFYHFFDIQN